MQTQPVVVGQPLLFWFVFCFFWGGGILSSYFFLSHPLPLFRLVAPSFYVCLSLSLPPTTNLLSPAPSLSSLRPSSFVVFLPSIQVREKARKGEGGKKEKRKRKEIEV